MNPIQAVISRKNTAIYTATRNGLRANVLIEPVLGAGSISYLDKDGA